VEAGGFDAGARSGEGCGKDDCIGERQGVGGVWFGRIDLDPVVTGKGRWIEPGAIGEERVAAEGGDGRLEMQTTGDRHGDDFVVVGREHGGELADAFGVATFGDADEKIAADAENIAAFECAGKRDMLKFAESGNGLGERRRFGAARCGAEREDDGEFIENDGGIFYKHGIGKVRLGGKRKDTSAECFEELLVGVVLRARDFQIDRLARNET